MAYWLERRIRDRNESFERGFDSFQKFEILSESYSITAVIIYRCYPVTPSRQEPKYALGASGPLAMGTNCTHTEQVVDQAASVQDQCSNWLESGDSRGPLLFRLV